MDRKREVEVFGVTYDRYVLLQLHRIMTQSLSLKTVVEMPSHGAKAAGSLYSIGFGLSGCKVTLVNPEAPEREKVYADLVAYCTRDTWAMVAIHKGLLAM